MIDAMNYLVGQQLVRTYTITSIGAGDAAFDRLKGHDSSNQSFDIWVLKSHIEPHSASSLLEYMERVMAINQALIDAPTQVFSETNLPALICYREVKARGLGDAFREITSVDERIEIWEQAFEGLFELHKSGLCHGLVDDKAFSVAGKTTALCQFGYAPLIDSGSEEARDVCRTLLAPEVRVSGSVTISSDIYALGKLVGAMHPEVISSEWYESLTHLDPEQRPRRVRGALDGLVNLLRAHPRSTIPSTGGLVPDGAPVEQDKSFPVPLGTVRASVDPPGLGSVTGTGAFKYGSSIVLSAQANAGSVFKGWSGDSSGTNPKLELTVTKDINLTATFSLVAVRQSRFKYQSLVALGVVVCILAGLGINNFREGHSKEPVLPPVKPTTDPKKHPKAPSASELVREIEAIKSKADGIASRAFALCASFNGAYIEQHHADPKLKQDSKELAAQAETTINQGLAIYQSNPDLVKKDLLPALDIDLALSLAIQQKPFQAQLAKAKSEFDEITDSGHRGDAEVTGQLLSAVLKGERVIWADSAKPTTPFSSSPPNA